jgi:hypothetical protein
MCRSVGIPMGGDGLAVKPSAQPTLVRTQHLPRKTPGQTRCRCSRMPGLMRVRGRSGRPLTVAVGQPWARSGQVSGLCRRGPERAGRYGSAMVPRLADVVSTQVRGHIVGGGMVSGVQWRPAGSHCDTDTWRTGPSGLGSGFVGQPRAARPGGGLRQWLAGLCGGCRAWPMRGAGGLFLAGDSVGAGGVQNGKAVPGAGCCFLGCDAGGEPQGQGGVAKS